MGKVTIQSIAKDLGLSRNTVSMAIKGNELVTSRTREMVLEYAKKVGYLSSKANEGAEEKSQAAEMQKQIRQHEPYHIMVLRTQDNALYWDMVISGISEEGSQNNCKIQVAVVSLEDEEKLVLPLGLDEQIHAVLCVKFIRVEYLSMIKDRGIPIIMLDHYKSWGGKPLGDIVKMESFSKIAELTRHLIDQGMTRIGYLSENSARCETMYDRYDGYQYAMRKANLIPNPSFVQPDGKEREFYCEKNFAEIVDSFTEMPEAVVCGNDSIAKFLTWELRKRGIRVPEDVAVTGFDDAEETVVEPFFTTVHVDTRWLGRRMIQCFLWRMQYPEAPYEKIVVDCKTIIRKSSCRCKIPES